LPTYDLHQHLWPPELIRALEARAEPPRLRGRSVQLPTGEWDVDLRVHDLDARLAVLDADGIDVALISCPPTMELTPELVDAYHDGIGEIVAASNGRLRALALGDRREGFAGTCISAALLQDVDALEPLLTGLERSGGLLFVHPGPEHAPAGAPPWWASVVGYTSQMQAGYAAWLAHGAARWPGLRVLFAILAGGAPIQLERFASRDVDTRTLLHENVFLDTASYGERALELALATYGIRNVVYGSDRPVIDAEPTLRAVRGFGQAVADAVCRDNPARLLG
jgi:6-methylsalicylate decarboxylase